MNAKTAVRPSIQWVLRITGNSEQWAGRLRNTDFHEWQVSDITAALTCAISIIQECQEDTDTGGVEYEDIKKHLKGVLSWTTGLKRHNARRTMPKTNTTGRGDPKPQPFYGYKYPQND